MFGIRLGGVKLEEGRGVPIDRGGHGGGILETVFSEFIPGTLMRGRCGVGSHGVGQEGKLVGEGSVGWTVHLTGPEG